MARLGVAQALLACGRVRINDVTFDFAEDQGDAEAAAAADHIIESGPAIEIDEALVLHTMRVRGFVTEHGFSESLGSHPAAILASLLDAEQIRHLEARGMYSLLPAGRARQETLLEGYADQTIQADLEVAYEPFLVLNTQFKQLCSDWQVRDGEPNDHADDEYDARCVARLQELTANAAPVLESLVGVLPRFSRYGERLAVAAAGVAKGEHKQFTGVMCESFHDIWMELHEDLIVLQRIDRKVEGSF